MNALEPHAIVGADLTRGDILLHFHNGESVLFRASFLWSVRQHDGNIALPPQSVDGDEVFMVPDMPE